MEAVILKCRPGSRFHLGVTAIRQAETLTDTAELIHSDVLFGAFISAVAQSDPEDIQKWKAHFESGNIRFSSAFYCVAHSGKLIYLLPKPVSLNAYRFPKDNPLLSGKHKQLKKVQFVSQKVWEQGLLPSQWFEENGSCFLPEKRAVFTKEEFNGNTPNFQLSQKTEMQKVRVRKETVDGNLYTQTDLVMMGSKDEKVQVHWYFLWDNAGLKAEEKAVARVFIKKMAENGIGGERSTGCGHIVEVDFDAEFQLNEAAESKWHTSLALTIPQKEEEEYLEAYQVLQRGGMYYGAEDSGRRIKMIHALAEGAVFSGSVSGRIADLSTSDRPHWRSGMAFPVLLPPAYQLNEESV